MKTIQDVLDWLQEAENNGVYTCGTQNVKRHLESVQKHQALSQHDVSGRSEQLVCDMCGSSKLEHCGGGDYSCEECGHYPITN